MDPGFNYHVATARLWGLMAIGLSDAVILPMNPEDEGRMMSTLVSELKSSHGEIMRSNNISLGKLTQPHSSSNYFGQTLSNLFNN